MKAILILISIVLINVHAFSQSACETLFATPLHRSDIFSPAEEIENAQKLSALIMNKMRQQSNRLERALRSKSNEVYDVIMIGAGPQSAAASLAISRTSLKGLVVEKTNNIASNFAEKEFFINSIETADLSMHDYPGSNLTFSMLNSRKYSSSLQLAAYIQAQQYRSRVPVLLNAEVVSHELRSHNGRPIVVIKLADGTELKTYTLIGATGLGEPTTRIPAPSYQQLFKQEHRQSLLDPYSIQTVMNTETFMRAFHLDPKRARKIYMPETLVIIGDGDGQRIVLEDLVESFVVLPPNFKIIIIGNDLNTKEQYIASRNGGDRYIERISQLYDRNLITAVDGRAVDAEITTDGYLRFKVVNKETGKETFVKGNMVVDSTGYENILLKEIGASLGGITLKEVEGHLQERSKDRVNVARQIVLTDGTAAPIYLVGAAAGALAKPEELASLRNKNPMAMYNNLGRTSAFVSQHFGLIPFERSLGQRETREPVIEADFIWQIIQSP